MTKELIRLSGLSKFYTGPQSVVIGLNNLELSFRRGEFVAITGESGSGKSTLSHVLSGILPYESGELYFEGAPTSHYDSADWERYRRDNISFISQSYGILPGATVLENVVSALLLTGMDKQESHAAAERLLKQVELWELRSRRAAKLSSGQKQRLSIARALAKPAPVLIADEPTGNLDPENSAKVISLLAQAARDRLVLLVTHEFPEAADSATRHIVLQDGRVIMDAALRPGSVPEPMPARSSANKPVSFYVARLQQRSRPVWSAFLVLFFALTAFAVFAFLGTFIVHLDDSSTRIYDNSAFKNGDPLRIVAVTMDGSPMTAEDWRTLANVDYVERVEPNGYVTDLQYAWREDVDYELVTYETLTTGAGGLAGTSVHVYAKLYAGAPYIQTIPVLPDGVEFLTAGRAPENLYEVVAQGDDSLLGETVTVYLANKDYWPSDQTLKLEMTVVGVTEFGSGLYFHGDIGRFFIQAAKTAQGGYTFLPAADLDDDHFRAHEDTIYGMESQYIRIREGMARNQKLEFLLPRDEKVFENVNPDGESVNLKRDSTETEGYYLWNVLRSSYLYCHETEQEGETVYKCIFLKTNDVYENDAQSFLFYPVEEMYLEADGSYSGGRYVIWNPAFGMALSSRFDLEFGQSGQFCYEAVPVTMEDGVLSGYTEDELWDVSLVQKNGVPVLCIQHDGENLSTDPPYYVDYNVQKQDFSAYWLVEDAKIMHGAHEHDQRRLIEVSYDRFDELTWDGGSSQVSLTITDYGYTQRVLEEVQGLGYAALSPYQLGSVKQDPELAQEREQTLLICLLALTAVVVLQMILLRAMFNAQTESYRLLSNIGLSARMARQSVLWQILSFALLGQLISVAALAVCWYRGVDRIVHILHYLPVGYMLLLLVVHLLVSVAAAVWVQSALGRQVYALTGRETDLPMEEDRKEAAR